MTLRYARKRLDLDVRDLARAALACVRPRAAEAAVADIAALWTPSDAVMVCLSVRSGLDLYLRHVDWPPGADVLMSAITIPQLGAIVTAHGYRPVAVDVDPAGLGVDVAALERARTPQTRAVLFAQLFGARVDTDALLAFCRSHRLVFIEDCAESYDGRTRELGRADVALYSFGLIKTATALGGAVVLVADPVVRSAMRASLAAHPLQPRRRYAAKMVKAAVLMALTHPAVFGGCCRVLQRLTGDYDDVLRAASRGFDDARLLEAIRHRPHPALLTVLAHRLRHYPAERVEARRRAGDVVAATLEPWVEHLGRSAARPTHWLFPIASADPEALLAAGRAAGFDLTRGSSTLISLDERCVEATRVMRDVVYLPAYAAMPPAALLRLAAVVNEVERAANKSSVR